MSGLVLVNAPATEPISVAEVMSHCRIDASNQEPPPGEITVALAAPAVPGNIDNGSHRYLATFITADGETQAGIVSRAVIVVDKAVNGQVMLTGIPLGGALVTARKLYRTAAGGSTYLLLATLANNTATTYTDNTADASLGAGAPSTNTTSDPDLISLIKAARSAAERITRRALVTQTWDWYLDAFPAWEVHIPKPTLQSIDSITYIDSDGVQQTLAPETYRVDCASEPGRISPAFGLIWPVTRWQSNAVKIRFVAGYGAAGAVPDGIKLWMKVRIKHFFDNGGPLALGERMTEFPRDFIDGLLDDFAVPNYFWTESV